MKKRRRIYVIGAAVIFSLIAVGLGPQMAAAHGGGNDGHSNVTTNCGFPHPEWRNGATIAGVSIQPDRHCIPDNPYRVATSVKGTNNVPMKVLMKSGLARDAVTKSTDRDNDGDPDVIEITLEVAGINEYNASSPTHQIAPGVNPSMWTFAPKARGMNHAGSKADALTETSSPVIRAEKGDTVRVTVENTHYMPHTIHFHGVDHAYERQNGTGNDGVPQTSEKPIMPGESRTYQFTPREAGTMFYHCHVTPNTHVQMGLSGMFVISENRTNNSVQTFNVEGGKVRHPSKAVAENYTAEYDLMYQALDQNLTRLPGKLNNPAAVAKAVNRLYDSTDESPDYFLLNGKSFPYTLQDSQIIVKPGERYKLRVSNAGPGTVALHTHGHKVNITATDGVEYSEKRQRKRDVVSVAPAQRLSLALNTTTDGLNAYSPGVWFMHDHREKAVTTDGISPGGGITMITYQRYLNRSTGMPQTETDLSRYFNASYYDGELPTFTDSLYTNQSVNVSATNVTNDPHNYHVHYGQSMRMSMVENGTVVNANTKPPGECTEIQGTRNITIRAGTAYADDGEVFGYDTEQFTFEPCTKVTVTFVNEDEVRHQWMLHGLPVDRYPMGMFNLEAVNGSVTGTFVTPKSGTLSIHCSVPQHAAKGMKADVTLAGSSMAVSSPMIGVSVVALLVGLLAAARYRQN